LNGKGRGTMKNPLNKRILRELKTDLGKYLVIFLFMVMLIGLVSGFLVADNSIESAYEEGFTKYNLEWGHFTLSAEPEQDLIDTLSEKGDVKLYDLRYFEEEEKSNSATIRVYKLRKDVNLECVMSGELPSAENEIALDRMYAQNAELEVGDTITLNGKALKISGLIAVPDYSCLFENNTDMMFDSINFSIAVMTEKGYDAVDSSKQFYNYAWVYNTTPADDIAEKNMSDDFLEVLKTELTSYDEELAMQGKTEKLVSIDNYLPRYNNQAVNFTGEDMGGDKAMFIIFDYIVIVILAFVFAVTISNTISQEAAVIGTLRASGYSKRELVAHYMVLPIMVTLIAAVVGNILGYTVLKDYMVDMYYDSYSLCTYETLWNIEAFVDTTVIPIILMFVVNLAVLIRKLQLSPLKFIRRDLSRKKKKKAFRLSTKIPFLHRFRMRIVFQNIPNYIVLFIGILFAGIIVVFSLMFSPMLEDYAEHISESMIASYQYVLASPEQTENAQAEKYSLTSLETTDSRYMTDEVSVFGVEDNSSYITQDIPSGKVLVSKSIMNKFSLKSGDTITLKEKYSDKTYDFVIADEYDYDATLAVFMSQKDYQTTFDVEDEYFTGYFSNEKLSDIDQDYVAAVITKDDLTKVSKQLLVSMGNNMELLKYFGVIMFILLMYLLSKQIIEKNSQSISMTKILGFSNGEIAGLYIVATSIVVIISLLLAVPITNSVLNFIFTSYLYTEITGYFPCNISNSCYIEMVVLGIISYAIVALLQMYKIKKIPKSDALKNVE
jgi:putative ABC transport system permease protein